MKKRGGRECQESRDKIKSVNRMSKKRARKE